MTALEETSNGKTRKDQIGNDAWTALIYGTQAFADPQGNERLTLTELDDNQIRYATQALILSDAFKSDLLRNVVISMAILNRSKKRQGEKAVISLVRNAQAKIMQNVQQSRFKRIMTNREELDYDKD